MTDRRWHHYLPAQLWSRWLATAVAVVPRHHYSEVRKTYRLAPGRDLWRAIHLERTALARLGAAVLWYPERFERNYCAIVFCVLAPSQQLPGEAFLVPEGLLLKRWSTAETLLRVRGEHDYWFYQDGVGNGRSALIEGIFLHPHRFLEAVGAAANELAITDVDGAGLRQQLSQLVRPWDLLGLANPRRPQRWTGQQLKQAALAAVMAGGCYAVTVSVWLNVDLARLQGQVEQLEQGLGAAIDRDQAIQTQQQALRAYSQLMDRYPSVVAVVRGLAPMKVDNARFSRVKVVGRRVELTVKADNAVQFLEKLSALPTVKGPVFVNPVVKSADGETFTLAYDYVDMLAKPSAATPEGG